MFDCNEVTPWTMDVQHNNHTSRYVIHNTSSFVLIRSYIINHNRLVNFLVNLENYIRLHIPSVVSGEMDKAEHTRLDMCGVKENGSSKFDLVLYLLLLYDTIYMCMYK
jgi:hypothetical protein